MDDVSPRIMFQCRIIFVKFTGNNLLWEARSWSHTTKDFLQLLQIMDVISEVNFIFVQGGPNGCGQRASFLAVFLGVLHEQIKMVAQG